MKYIVLFCLLPLVLFAELGPKKSVVVNNRVLAVVNGRVISVIDLMKKMDMLLYQRYPQYLEVPEARYQFYNNEWKRLLLDLIDRELVMADAGEKQFEVSSGDIREELEEIFGPNLMINLDSAGLTFEEAWGMLKADIMIRRMLHYQVRQRAYPKVTPTAVQRAYDVKVKTFGEQMESTWCAITIKGADVQLQAKVADAIYKMVSQEKITLTAIQEEALKRKVVPETITVSVSQPFRQKSQELAPNLREMFANMQPGSYSTPQKQLSRSDNQELIRIYFLQEQVAAQVPSLDELAPMLKEELLEELIAEGTKNYFTDLRRHYHVSKEQIEKDLPENFQPFELR